MIKKFNRYEFKYLIAHKEYLQIKDDLKKYMHPDKHAGEKGYYQISSLYYDSFDFSAFRNKIDGIKFRRKLRLRVYNDSEVRNGFVEIKQRINRTVQKRRIILPIDEAKALCSGKDIGMDRFSHDDRKTAFEVLFLVKSLGLRPKCIISYYRHPFESAVYDFGLRVTFDRLLKYRVNSLDFTEAYGNKYFFSPDTVIMEIKANDKVPSWLTSLIGFRKCQLERVSKYCRGILNGMLMTRNSRISQ